MDTPPNDPTITSAQNPRIKHAVKLRRRSHRDDAGMMLVEGYREIRLALDNRRRPKTVFICPYFFLGKNEPALIAECRENGAEILNCAPGVFQKIAYRDRPEGLLAVLPQTHRGLEDLTPGKHPFYVVAEAIEKPGNLGTILRSADAAGVDAVIVCDQRTDIFNPNVIRASIGTLFAMPVIIAPSEETIAWLHRRQIKTLAATPHAKQIYTQSDLTGGIAIVLGAEQYGLSEIWMNAADMQVRIPMRGQADSLNVAAAATILLFEACRQRETPNAQRAVEPLPPI